MPVRFCSLAAVAAVLLLAVADLSAVRAAAQSPAPQPVSIRFRAMMGEIPASCTTAFENIGTSHSTLHIQDLKLYVSSVRLITSAGSEVPLTLEQDGRWQQDDVSLLDFEDATGTCANGSKDMHAVVTGEAPAGQYVGLRFTMGVPFEKNHRDPVTAGAPLNLSRMSWVWNAGYKFLRFDYTSTGQPRGAFVHLGSTNSCRRWLSDMDCR